ncbi:electron transport complex subunit RsxC [Sphingobacterium sp. lm-10]|uniref:electron transport complex subunit RsxC n=1 Tax=Sphingobacterium sp. lm-10 TaxID=2944904 RepID=UPI00201FCE56|nr:electron transport complex subunit RsxC [Sphingobacterium sp. lm-10]MCL7986714.1 electron transport complex subunit RsxC [Sphingobacterium sp. lm-10]
MLLIPSLKSKTKKSEVGQIADPEDFYIPLDGYRNVMTPLVEIGNQVEKYQLLAACDGLFAASIHAPVSGIVKGTFNLNGKQFLHLQNDFRNRETLAAVIAMEEITQEQFAERLFEYGIEGAGGSRFPTGLKFKKNETPIKTIIVNGAECEPYLSADYALMKHHTAELLRAAVLIKKVLGAEQIVFAIEKQNKELEKLLLRSARENEVKINVKILPDSYPQGGELQVIKSVTGKELKKGSIPAQHGILVNNVGTLWSIYNAFFHSRPTIERIVTISGNRCANTGNYKVKIGTPIAHLLRETGNEWNPDEQMIILGGAMMGKAVSSPLLPIHKGSGGLLVMQKLRLESDNCIKCGACVDVCPQKLMPLEFVRFNQSGNTASLKDFNLLDCIECGACAYVCPSDVPLMENIFRGKDKLLKNA